MYERDNREKNYRIGNRDPKPETFEDPEKSRRARRR